MMVGSRKEAVVYSLTIRGPLQRSTAIGENSETATYALERAKVKKKNLNHTPRKMYKR